MKNENIFIGQIEDKIRQCENQYVATNTGFLDTHQQSVARSLQSVRGLMSSKSAQTKMVFYGGYEEAERTILMCLPDYETLEDVNPLTVIRVTKTEGGRQLTHRDYLGSLVGLGIKREKIGDILVGDDGADVIVLQEIADFILLNYGKAGRTYLSVSQVDISQLKIPETRKITATDTVASLRLDNIVSSAFGMSRSKAVEAVKGGLVFVNHMEMSKIDYQVKEGDSIVLRHKGKVNLIETGGTSRKGRLYVTYEKFQ